MFVRADGAVAYQDLVVVMDKLKEGGVEKVGLVTRPAAATLMDAVTDVLIDRSREAEKLSRMVLVSLVAHARADRARRLAAGGLGIGACTSDRDGDDDLARRRARAAAGHQSDLGEAGSASDTGRAKPKVEAPPALPKPEMIEPLKTAKPAAEGRGEA